MIKCLIHPFTHTVVAELEPEKELIVHDKNLINELTDNGITISGEFRKLNPGVWKVYPNDEKEIFAKAFEQFYSIYLQRQGYYWRDKREYEAALATPTKELVERVLSAHAEYLKQNPPVSKKRTIEQTEEKVEPELEIPSKNIDPDQENDVS